MGHLRGFVDKTTGFIHFRDNNGNVVGEILQTSNGESVLRHDSGEFICQFAHTPSGVLVSDPVGGSSWGMIDNDVFGNSVFHDWHANSSITVVGDIESTAVETSHITDSFGDNLGSVSTYDLGNAQMIDIDTNDPSCDGTMDDNSIW